MVDEVCIETAFPSPPLRGPSPRRGLVCSEEAHPFPHEQNSNHRWRNGTSRVPYGNVAVRMTGWWVGRCVELAFSFGEGGPRSGG